MVGTTGARIIKQKFFSFSIINFFERAGRHTPRLLDSFFENLIIALPGHIGRIDCMKFYARKIKSHQGIMDFDRDLGIIKYEFTIL